MDTFINKHAIKIQLGMAVIVLGAVIGITAQASDRLHQLNSTEEMARANHDEIKIIKEVCSKMPLMMKDIEQIKEDVGEVKFDVKDLKFK